MKQGYAFNLDEMIIKFGDYFYQVFPPNGIESGNQSKRFATEVISHIKYYLSQGQEPCWTYATDLESLKIYNHLKFIEIE